MIWPRDQNVPRKVGESTPAVSMRRKVAQRPSKDEVVLIHLRPCLISSCVQPAELSDAAENRKVFFWPPRAAASATSPE